MKPATSPDPIDVQFGKLLRMTRSAHGLSQEKLGAMNGLTFQQIQKYERGQNRVSVSRLVHLAKSLGVQATWFLEKLNDNASSTDEQISGIDLALLNKREIQNLMRSYIGVKDKDQRQFLQHIIALLAAHDKEDCDV